MVECSALGILVESLAGASPADAVDGALEIVETDSSNIFQFLARRQEGPLITGDASHPHVTVSVVRAASSQFKTLAPSFAFPTDALPRVLARSSIL